MNEAAEDYCRRIEAYLCRKNDGHLVRIVGPGFEQVCGWATQGVPFAVACRGIDRFFERYYAKGPRRRPVQIQFCEADVLDSFDDWRRAVGIPLGATSQPGADGRVEAAQRQPESLPSHLERVIARLTALRGGERRVLDPHLDTVIRELDVARAGAKSLRGAARDALLERLRMLDAQLMEAAIAGCDDVTLRHLGAEADAELAPFRDRLTPDAYDQARRACVIRLLRDRESMPSLAFP